MQDILSIIFKSVKRAEFLFSNFLSRNITIIIFYLNKISIGDGFKTTGIPFISVARGGKASIGNKFKVHNRLAGNPIGRSHKSVIVVGPKGNLIIGNGVGISFTAINCKEYIEIKDNVMIGGGTCIYDSDFHPLNVNERVNQHNDSILSGPITINQNAFVGANSTILKGVTIGENSIVGACSVVTKNIPANEIWAGNPAKFIKNV